MLKVKVMRFKKKLPFYKSSSPTVCTKCISCLHNNNVIIPVLILGSDLTILKKKQAFSGQLNPYSTYLPFTAQVDKFSIH